MTSDEIKETLQEILELAKNMDKEHLKKILKILMISQQKNRSDLLPTAGLRNNVNKAINDCMKKDHLEKTFTCHQMKQIYQIMGDYGYYPTCKLCGQPVKIDTKTSRNSLRYAPLEFSWDHIYPKSLGGSNDLVNMQVAHKACNNTRGNTLLESEHYVINITVNFMSFNSLQNHDRSKKYNRRYGKLRKRNSWCCKCNRQKHR